MYTLRITRTLYIRKQALTIPIMISSPATYVDATGKQITPTSDRTPSTASDTPSSGPQHGMQYINM